MDQIARPSSFSCYCCCRCCCASIRRRRAMPCSSDVSGGGLTVDAVSYMYAPAYVAAAAASSAYLACAVPRGTQPLLTCTPPFAPIKVLAQSITI